MAEPDSSPTPDDPGNQPPIDPNSLLGRLPFPRPRLQPGSPDLSAACTSDLSVIGTSDLSVTGTSDLSAAGTSDLSATAGTGPSDGSKGGGRPRLKPGSRKNKPLTRLIGMGQRDSSSTPDDP